ncbi:glycosyltransferase, partial [Schumannella luteola]
MEGAQPAAPEIRVSDARVGGSRDDEVSVAICTRDGERYLPAQLDSILAGSELPAEVVVIDDTSTDGTVAILERFAETARA